MTNFMMILKVVIWENFASEIELDVQEYTVCFSEAVPYLDEDKENPVLDFYQGKFESCYN